MKHKYIDAHTHSTPELHSYEAYHCVNSVTESEWEALIHSANTRSDIIPFLGIHPWYVGTVTSGWDERLRSKVLSLKGLHLVGIGECGLDRTKVSFDLQREVCRTQLEIAKETNTPLSIHCVRAWSDLLELFKKVNMQHIPILLHSFSGNREIAQQLQKWNVFFSLKMKKEGRDGGGENSLRTKATRAPFLYLPRERLLLESDNSQERNSTCTAIEQSYTHLARLLELSEEDCAELIEENFNRYIHTD
jgi:TatD DNase family protein